MKRGLESFLPIQYAESRVRLAAGMIGLPLSFEENLGNA
jgi:hypothetical protein